MIYVNITIIGGKWQQVANIVSKEGISQENEDLLTLVRHKESDDCDYDRKLLKNTNKWLEYDLNTQKKVSSYHISFRFEFLTTQGQYIHNQKFTNIFVFFY